MVRLNGQCDRLRGWSFPICSDCGQIKLFSNAHSYILIFGPMSVNGSLDGQCDRFRSQRSEKDDEDVFYLHIHS